ncbi:STAS domain-containing protein [Plantactinospora siamensis]|uniref:STAS domain-containing protein n=1 Tax=Plantactinospora siamensis TaxID=555372 RepID=A0ABV6P257_9ACTN
MQRGDGPAPAPLTITADETDPANPTMLVAGDLDFNTAPTLWTEAQALIAPGRHGLILDVAGLRFVDSTGLAVIVQAWQACQQGGIVLELRAVPRFLENILRITGVAELLARQGRPAGETGAGGEPGGPHDAGRNQARTS